MRKKEVTMIGTPVKPLTESEKKKFLELIAKLIKAKEEREAAEKIDPKGKDQ